LPVGRVARRALLYSDDERRIVGTGFREKNPTMMSAIFMLRRFMRGFVVAWWEQDFAPILAAAVLLIVVGTTVYSVGEGWSVTNGFYFAIATLTTSSVADPGLVITDPWLKVFTSLYVLTGIGIFVEVARRLGTGFTIALHEGHEAKAARHESGAARQSSRDQPG